MIAVVSARWRTPLVTAVIVAVLPAGSAVALARSTHEHHATAVRDVDAAQAAVRGLLVTVIDENPPLSRPRDWVSFITLAGKRLPVPPRVRETPGGVSPDARLVARTTFEAVLVGAVSGGSMTTVLRRHSSSMCPTGASFAWRPDSRRLAVAVNPVREPTVLRLADRNGHVVRSLTLPRSNPLQTGGGRACYQLVAWSPGGKRLLLLRMSSHGYTGFVVLDIKSGKSRTLTLLRRCSDLPTASWSPNGRLVAVTTRKLQGCKSRFTVADATNGRAIIQQSSEKGESLGGTVWAADSRSVFGTFVSPSKPLRLSTRIDRTYLTGRRTTVIRPRFGILTPYVGLAGALVYTASPENVRSDSLYIRRFAAGHSDLLLASHKRIYSVLLLERLP